MPRSRSAVWLYLTPPVETMRTFAPGWIALVLARNLGLAMLFFGAFHLRLYIRKAQGNAFKYNPKWLDVPTIRIFLFRDQTADNMIWTLASGVPIWTAYEVADALGRSPTATSPGSTWAAHPV